MATAISNCFRRKETLEPCLSIAHKVNIQILVLFGRLNFFSHKFQVIHCFVLLRCIKSCFSVWDKDRAKSSEFCVITAANCDIQYFHWDFSISKVKSCLTKTTLLLSTSRSTRSWRIYSIARISSFDIISIFSVEYTKITIQIIILYTFYLSLRATTFFLSLSLSPSILFCSWSFLLFWINELIFLFYFTVLLQHINIVWSFSSIFWNSKICFIFEIKFIHMEVKCVCEWVLWLFFFVCVWFHFAQQKSQRCIERMEKRLSGDSHFSHIP